MGLFLIDYFRCEPSELNFRILSFGGFWPIPTKRISVQIIYSIYSFVCTFFPLTLFFIQILDLYLLRNDKVNLVKNASASCVTLGSLIKHLILMCKIEKINHLHKMLKDFKCRTTDPEDVKILEKGEKEILWMTRSFYALSIPCIIVWMLYPGLESSHERRVPFPYRFPVDFKTTPWYEIIYTYHSFSLVGFLFNILSSDLIFCSFVIRINAESNIIAKNFLTLFKETENNFIDDGNAYAKENQFDSVTNERIVCSIKKNVKLQQKVFEEIRQLQDIYSVPCLIHFIQVVVLLGCIIVDIVMVTKGFKLELIQRMMYGACGLVDTFLPCYFTSKLGEQNKNIINSIYETPWHEMSPNIRKYFIFMMMRMKQPSTLMVSHWFPLNLATFLECIKLTYNITALLYHTIRK